jgi:hypothetical protein
VLDDGWGGLSAGGDVKLLQEAGTACVAHDPSAADAAPACEAGAGNPDPACDAWLASIWPHGAPVIAVCSSGWALPDGGHNDRCELIDHPARCVPGDVGDRYCNAWAAQFYAGTAVNGWACWPRQVPDPVILGDADVCVQGPCENGMQCNVADKQACVQSADGTSCAGYCASP